VLDARADVDVPLDALLAPGGAKGPPRWEASGSANLVNFPLGGLAALSGGQIGGLASGTVRVKGINRDPEIDGTIEFVDLKVDRARFPRGVAVIKVAKGGVVASANLEQTSGSGSATATARVKWTSALAPELDTREPLDVYFVAKDFRAAALYPPLLSSIFTYFDGRLNGTLHLHQEVANDEVAQAVDGSFDLKEGVFQVAAVGQEFRNATAKIAMTKRGEVEISDVAANGVSGKLTASGKMMLKGVSFVSAEGEARIAKNEPVPLTLQGVSLGEAWGTSTQRGPTRRTSSSTSTCPSSTPSCPNPPRERCKISTIIRTSRWAFARGAASFRTCCSAAPASSARKTRSPGTSRSTSGRTCSCSGGPTSSSPSAGSRSWTSRTKSG
jgi:hypothetical protein